MGTYAFNSNTEAQGEVDLYEFQVRQDLHRITLGKGSIEGWIERMVAKIFHLVTQKCNLKP